MFCVCFYMQHSELEILKLSVVVNVNVCELCDGLAMCPGFFLCLWPCGWDRLQSSHDPTEDKWFGEWMNGIRVNGDPGCHTNQVLPFTGLAANL